MLDEVSELMFERGFVRTCSPVFDACSGFGFDSFEARDFLQAVPSMSPLFFRFTWLESMTRNNVIGSQ